MSSNFQTQYNRDYNIGQETITQPSKTIPDQSMPIIEIVKRYANGQPLGGGVKNPVWQGEDSGIPDNWDRMDISEKQDFMENHLTEIEVMRQDLEDQKNKTGRYKPKVMDKDIQQPAPSAGSSADSTPKTT